MVNVSYNERSWAIDLIAHIKNRVRSQNRTIKDAGGEQTVSSEGGVLFPDVLLFGDRSSAVILQGWELKLPDTPIDDLEFHRNASLKASALGLDSFLLWNVVCARLYSFDKEFDQYILSKQWPTLDNITDRLNVQAHRNDWEMLADSIISDLNDLFENGSLKGKPFIDAYSTGGINNLILRNKSSVAEMLKQTALCDHVLRSEITLWWGKNNSEYGSDEDQFQVLARVNLYNWIGKFLFAHILQSRDNRAKIVDKITETTSPSEALRIFEDLSNKCNFWPVFACSLGLSIISDGPWNQIVQFNKLLIDLQIGSIDQSQLSIILEAAVETAARKIRGQYVTPPSLAKLIVALSLRNIMTDRFLDPCCGSGTIARSALEYKLTADIPPDVATCDVIAGDIDPQATQITTLAMVTPSLMHVPIRIFCSDALLLNPSQEIKYQNPSNGESFTESIGIFNTIASNLPFISQKGRSHYSSSINHVFDLLRNESINLPRRADISAYFPFALHSLLSQNGRLVIIISNAWLSTDWGEKFYSLILRYYSIKSIITSGAGRWFENSKIVANIIVLEKREISDECDELIDFVVLKLPLEELSTPPETISVTSSQIELGKAQDDRLSIQSIHPSELDLSRKRGLGFNAHFVNCSWAGKLPLTLLTNLCTVHRGERRGWDKMFYPDSDHGIEEEYIKPVLKSSTNISQIMTTAVDQAFCCSASIEELHEHHHNGAIRWIRRFEAGTNNIGKPLVEALDRSGMFWYEMKSTSMAELVIPLNFGERLFVSILNPPAFVNQRLIRLNCLKDVDIGLLSAILNCAISLFYLEGLGLPCDDSLT
ncbi:MAG: N-6 DNA methylase [Bacteroidetes bacterium]|nr:N-6 DNA methylase [Bacteroidota bacterium]